MLQRKALRLFESWKANKGSQALLVTGARQTGKTYLIEEFARSNYEHFVKFDFVDQLDVLDAVRKARNSSELFLTLSAFAGADLVPGQTLIFFDEVQECPEALTFIKYLVQRQDFDFILSGSLLGVELRNVRSLPVGYLDVVEMYPLDFEEYCWANGVGGDVWAAVQTSFDNAEPVLEGVHQRLLALFHQYLIVGGMPRVVETFVQTQNLARVKSVQDNILALYRMDVSKYAQGETLLIKEIFDQMPSQLNSQSKRFAFSDIKKGTTFDKNAASFLWLVNAGIALPVRNVAEPRHPLRLSENRSFFKLFMNDVGLLSASCGMEVAKSIVSDELGVNYGSIYENAVAQELKAHGFDLFYFRSKGMGELDFVVEQPGGAVLPIEVKSGKSYKRHSALDNVLGSPNYAIDRAIVLCEANVSSSAKVLYLPVYMAPLLRR